MKTTRMTCILLMILVIISLAWKQYPNTPEVPYTGVYSKVSIFQGLETRARIVKWDADGVWWMQHNVWAEVFDQTADCTANSPTGDKLIPNYVGTNIPLNGQPLAWDDCDGPNPNVNEELEISIKSDSVVAEFAYNFDVGWLCNSSSISGEVNITFEMDAFGGKYWLDKETYSMTSCLALAPSSTQTQDPSELNNVEDAKTGSASEANPQRGNRVLWSTQDPTSTYTYYVIETDQGKTRVRVQVDFHVPGVFNRYRELNASLLNAPQGIDQSTKAVVTFASPISTIEAQELVKRTGMTVLAYGASGQDASGRLFFIYIFPQSQAIEGIPNIEGVQVDGIMLLTGMVERNTDVLASLARNPQVALMDMIYETVKRDVEARLGYPIEWDQIGVTDPAWHIASGEIKP